jgi:adenine-specific DNA-methyltransferase
MNKIELTTTDGISENVKKISELFPNVVKEAGDDKTLKVDFELLKQQLSDDLIHKNDERFRLDWPGKMKSLLKANQIIDKILRPVRDESVNFDNAENLFIEGDNFEALKILKRSYAHKVKMIYIDPPYNTGKDFIYSDNMTKDKISSHKEEGFIDGVSEEKLVSNSKSNARFHSDWLSMMYERLYIARDLLTDDGVIFISIDDNEQANLKKICDEIFGEDNFIAQIIVHSNPRGRQSSKFIAETHESVLLYSKSKGNAQIFGSQLTLDEKAEYKFECDDGGKYRELGLRLRGGGLQLLNLQLFIIRCFTIHEIINYQSILIKALTVFPYYLSLVTVHLEPGDGVKQKLMRTSMI